MYFEATPHRRVSSFEYLKGRKTAGRTGQRGIKDKKGYHLLNLCSSFSHLLSTHICAVPTRRGRAECRAHLLFSPSRRPPCIAAVCWFLIWVCVFRPDDACQKGFSWFPDWIQKVQKCIKTHKYKSCRSRQELSREYLLANIGVDTAENGPLKVCQKLLV